MTAEENSTENMNTDRCCGSGEGRHWKRKASGAFGLLAISGSLLLLAMFFSTIKEYKFIGAEVPPQTTISVSGDGEAYAAPDIATVSFAINQTAKTQSEASKLVNDAMKKLHAFLTDSKVEDKDIKTTGYDLYPKYEYVRQPCVTSYAIEAGSYVPPCENGKQVLSGYTVNQSVEVKIRTLDDAGKILAGLSDNGATNLSGLTFSVDKPDTVKAQARQEAITKAKEKANELAKELGVKLVRIVSFNEGGVYPIYNYAPKAMDMAMSAGAAPESANIPIGENKYTSNVTITYEIR